ncbi:MAG: glutaminyl-peptide cyclotransferase [Anaerolineales bacterium]
MHGSKFALLLLLTILMAWPLAALYAQPDDDAPPERLRVEVLNTYPHQTDAWTQGLELHNGLLYESTGRRGASTLREVDPQTGEVLRGLALADAYFGEGLTRVDDELIQLTWTAGIAFVYDFETFERRAAFFYATEGWGLCYDGENLYMSDGTSTLYVRETRRFQIIDQITVTLEGQPRNMLNELECANGQIYANVWQTDEVVIIDPTTGRITGVIDASGLLTDAERANLGANPDTGAVLNGIAYDAENDVFFITGKLWPTMFEVRFVPAED